MAEKNEKTRYNIKSKFIFKTIANIYEQSFNVKYNNAISIFFFCKY